MSESQICGFEYMTVNMVRRVSDPGPSDPEIGVYEHGIEEPNLHTSHRWCFKLQPSKWAHTCIQYEKLRSSRSNAPPSLETIILENLFGFDHQMGGEYRFSTADITLENTTRYSCGSPRRTDIAVQTFC